MWLRLFAATRKSGSEVEKRPKLGVMADEVIAQLAQLAGCPKI